MIQELLAEAGDAMSAVLEHTVQEFATVRTGRANPQILNRVSVEYYGARTPLQQLASTSVPEARMLMVTPFDKGILSDIEAAIRDAGLGLSTGNDGNVIRISFPILTEERRRELVKVVRSMGEDGKVGVRRVRRATKEDLEALEGEISEDEIRRGEKSLQDLTDQNTDTIDNLLAQKEQELLEV